MAKAAQLKARLVQFTSTIEPSSRKQTELLIELAIYHLDRHIETVENQVSTAGKSLYLVLKEMYYEVDDFENVEEITRAIVSKFE